MTGMESFRVVVADDAGLGLEFDNGEVVMVKGRFLHIGAIRVRRVDEVDFHAGTA